MSPTRAEIAAAIGCSPTFVSNHAKPGELHTELAETSPGVARYFDFRNALELAFIAALTDAGYSMTAAKMQAAEWVEAEAAGTLPRWHVENRATGKSVAFNAQNFSVEGFAYTLTDDAKPKGRIAAEGEHYTDTRSDTRPPSGTRYAIIHLSEIVRRVEKLFAAI